jgi:aminopeptidase-like protein
MNILAYADGTRDLVDMASFIGISGEEAVETAERLADAGLLVVA